MLPRQIKPACNGHEFNTLAGDLAELVIPHSDARQIVQIATSALVSSTIVKSATLCGTLKDGVNEELVAFFAGPRAPA